MVGGLLGSPPTFGSVADSMLFFAFPSFFPTALVPCAAVNGPA